jgi:hypothetical protein
MFSNSLLQGTEPFLRILWNPKVYFRVRKSPSLVPLLCQVCPARTTPFCICRTHFNIIIPPASCLPSGPFPSDFPTKFLDPLPFSLMRAIWLAYLILLDLNILLLVYLAKSSSHEAHFSALFSKDYIHWKRKYNFERFPFALPIYHAGRQRGEVRVPGGSTIFSSLCHPNRQRALPSFLYSGVMRPERETKHLPSTSAEVKVKWIYASAPPYVFMA